jgi:pimeloyl-ACP methyl ester carboxylesterase
MSIDGYRCIAYDKRGYGRTPWEAGDYSDTDDALAVLDQLGVETAVIVGCSMGGGTTLDLAIRHPDRVDGIVLVGAFPSGWTPADGWEESPLEEEAAAAAEAGDFDRAVEIDLQMWLVGYGRSADEVPEDLKELFRDMDRVPVTTQNEREKHQIGFTTRFNDYLHEIESPALVVVGANDEKLLVDAAHHMAAVLGGSTPVVIDGAAHLPSLERPEVFNTVLGDFLASL